jgi:hypothetical protein
MSVGKWDRVVVMAMLRFAMAGWCLPDSALLIYGLSYQREQELKREFRQDSTG